jgi:hypothetical protein
LTPQWTPENSKSVQDRPATLPPALAEIVAAWPKLPEHIKAAIRALANTSGTPKAADE